MADLYYIEDGYFDPSLGYYVYTADAAAAISSSATMSVSIEKIISVEASITAAFTISATLSALDGADVFAFTEAALLVEVSRIRDNNIAASGVFSAAIDITRIIQVNADELAEFSFTSEVVRSRDYASSLAAAFSLSSTETKIYELSAALSAEFTQTSDAVKVKSADAAISSSATLTANSEITKDYSAALSSQSTLSVTAYRITQFAAANSSAFTASIQAGYRKQGNIAITSAFTASLSANYFKGTALLTGAAATLTVSPKYTFSGRATIAASVSLTATGYRAPRDNEYPGISDRALMHMDTDPYVDAFGGTLSNASGGTLVSGKFSNAIGYPITSGTISNGTTFTNLFNQSDWTVDFWWKPRDLTTGTNVQPFVSIFAFSLTKTSTGNPDQTIHIGWEQTTLISNPAQTASGRIYVGPWWSQWAETADTTYTYDATSKDATSWKHIAVTYQNLGPDTGGPDLYDLRIGLFIDGVGGFTNVNGVGNYLATSSAMHMFQSLVKVPDRDGLGSYTRIFQGYVDEVRFMPTVQYTGNFTPPTSAYAPNVYYKQGAALLEGKFSLTANAYEVEIAQAALSATTSLTATITHTEGARANLTAVASQTTQAKKTAVGAAALSTAASQATNGTRIKQFASALSSNFTATTNVIRVRRTTAALSATASITLQSDNLISAIAALTSTASLTAANVRVRYADTSFEAIATELTAAVKNATGTVTLESTFTLTADAVKTADLPIVIGAQAVVNVEIGRVVQAAMSAASQATLAAAAIKYRPTGADLSSEFTFTADFDKFITLDTLNLQVITNQNTNTALSRTRGFASSLITSTTLTAINIRVRIADSALNSQFTGAFVLGKIVRITATMASQGFQLTLGDIINLDPALTYVVRAENRLFVINAESRALIILPETRDYII